MVEAENGEDRKLATSSRTVLPLSERVTPGNGLTDTEQAFGHQGEGGRGQGEGSGVWDEQDATIYIWAG